MRTAKPEFYTAGADIYTFGRYAIVTGARPFGEEVPNRVTEPLENAAAVLYHIDKEAADKEMCYRLGSDVRDFERETNRLSDMVNDVLCEAHALKEKRA